MSSSVSILDVEDIIRLQSTPKQKAWARLCASPEATIILETFLNPSATLRSTAAFTGFTASLHAARATTHKYCPENQDTHVNDIFLLLDITLYIEIWG